MPAGHAVAEIWQQGELALYRARVEVAFAYEHTPQRLVKALMGLQSPNEAQTACNQFTDFFAQLLNEQLLKCLVFTAVRDLVAGFEVAQAICVAQQAHQRHTFDFRLNSNQEVTQRYPPDT